MLLIQVTCMGIINIGSSYSLSEVLCESNQLHVHYSHVIGNRSINIYTDVPSKAFHEDDTYVCGGIGTTRPLTVPFLLIAIIKEVAEHSEAV